MKRKREDSKPEDSVPEAKRLKRVYNGVWISRLPQHVTEKELRNYIDELGKVSKIVMFCNPELEVKKNTFAGILYDGKISDDVLDYDGALVLKSAIKLRYLKEDDFKVRLEGVDIPVDELKEIIEEAGKVKEIKKVGEFEYTILFQSLEDIDNVLKFSGSDIHGKVISIKYSNLEEDL